LNALKCTKIPTRFADEMGKVRETRERWGDGKGEHGVGAGGVPRSFWERFW